MAHNYEGTALDYLCLQTSYSWDSGLISENALQVCLNGTWAMFTKRFW